MSIAPFRAAGLFTLLIVSGALGQDDPVAVTAVNRSKLELTLSLDLDGKKVEEKLQPGEKKTLTLKNGVWAIVAGVVKDGRAGRGRVLTRSLTAADRPRTVGRKIGLPAAQ